MPSRNRAVPEPFSFRTIRETVWWVHPLRLWRSVSRVVRNVYSKKITRKSTLDCCDVNSRKHQTGTEVCDRDGKPYLETDTSHYGLPCRGRGEVLIRGHSVSSGYLKKIEKTQKEFDKYGYFHTGDIAIFTTDGCIKIVDRLKNLVKLKGGEYIALESMEKEYVENHIKITQTSVCSNMKTELLHSRKTQQIREKYLCRR